MSLILDALRKSDVERSRQQAPQVAGAAAAAPERPRRAWVVPVVVLLALNAALLAWILLRPTPGGDPAADRFRPDQPVTVETAPIAGTASPDVMPAATPTTAPATQRPKAVVRSLADESRMTSPVEPPATDDAPAAPARETTVDAPVDAAGPEPSAQADAPADARTLVDRGVVPADALAIELHVFGSDPARRFAFVGGRKVTAGDTLAAGIGVVEVVRDGVVIEHRGTRYLLRRD